MSGAAKFIVATIGGGLLLGAVGGHLANPVMQQRGGDEPWRQMLEPDTAPDYRGDLLVEAPPRDLMPYGGSYSYAPAFADEPIGAWPDPYAEAEWLEYESWPEPPTIAELDARWEAEALESQVYARTVEFPQTPSVESAAAGAEQAADEARSAAEAETEDDGSLPAEPRIARGELPAIW